MSIKLFKSLSIIIAIICVLVQPGTSTFAVSPSSTWFSFNISPDTAKDNIIDAGKLVLDAPAGKHGFVKVKDGHFFFEDGTRARFSGTNFSLKASFPDHATAEKTAANLAKYGFNIVRLHLMDWDVEPMGIFAKSSGGSSKLSPEQLDRMDYLIYQLKKRGIYVDMNLHVGRQFTSAEGVTDADKLPANSKIVTLFDTKLIELQKQYASNLLTHLNTYTGTKYNQEPSVAMVEITNENSLFPAWSSGELFGSLESGASGTPLTQYYLNELDKKWNEWLKAKYKTTQNLMEAWDTKDTENGENLAKDPDSESVVQHGWVKEVHDGVKADFSLDTSDKVDGSGSLRADIKQVGSGEYMLQYKQLGIKLEKGKNYEVTFNAKADSQRNAVVLFGKETSPWTNYGLWNTIPLTTQWKQYKFVFAANTTTDEDTRFSFELGQTAGKVWLDKIKLVPINAIGLKSSESLEKSNISRAKWPERFVYSERRISDNVEFYTSLEKQFYTGMLSYIHNTLNVKVPVSTTNSYYGQPDLAAQSEGDYMNTHGYWDHPTFPDTLWDKNNFKMKNNSLISDNASLTGTSTADTFLGKLSLSAVAGKPFVVSEWNQVFPNRYEYEAPAMLTAYALLQDWDALFVYSYSHGEFNGDKNSDYSSGWFDIINNPDKLAQMPACAVAFIRGDFKAANKQISLNYSESDVLNNYRYEASGSDYNINGFLPFSTVYTHGIRKSSFEAPKTSSLNDLISKDEANTLLQQNVHKSDTGEINWNKETEGHEYITFNTPRFQGADGFLNGKKIALDNLKLSLSTDCSATLVSMDGKQLNSSGKMLLTLVAGHKNNTSPNSDVMEPVKGTVEIDTNNTASCNVYSLDCHGNRLAEKQAVKTKGLVKFDVGSDSSLWYEIVYRAK